MKERCESRFLSRPLAGVVVLLALVVVSLFLTSLADPAPGLAAPLPTSNREPSLLSPDQSDLVTHTVFLPLVSRTETEEGNVWLAEYYANTTLSGDPVRTDEETRIDYYWNDGAPTGLPKDLFSVRWTGSWDFEYGEYTFYVYADDGVRFWLDGELLIDEWTVGAQAETAKLIVEPEGRHSLKLEYYEQREGAYVHLHWIRTDLQPPWKAEYFRLPWVEKASKVYEQEDTVIQFDWEEDCPEDLPSCDAWSVAWRSNPVFTEGTHRIFFYADDGYQLLVDGNLKEEGGWQDGQAGGGVDDHYDLEVDELEHHMITFNYHNRGGLAEARVWIQDLEQPDWKVEYFNNEDLAGSPAVVDTEPAIFHDWKWDSPHRHVQGDHFSIRWSGQRAFYSGCYVFGLFADDGVRLWVDGELLVDEWHDGRDEYSSPATYLSSGNHDIVVEYFDETGEAEIRFWWE